MTCAVSVRHPSATSWPPASSCWAGPCGSPAAPALVVAAVVHGELLTLRPFAAANGVVARAVARLLLTARGLDPTGSLVAESAWAAALNPYLGAAAGFATGSPDGVGRLGARVRRRGGGGAAEARVIADGVLAGSLGSRAAGPLTNDGAPGGAVANS